MRIEIAFTPRKFALLLAVIVAAIWILSLLTNLVPFMIELKTNRELNLVHFFDVNSERSLPTWYSSFALMFCAVLLGSIAQRKRQEQDAYRWHWFGLALIFIYLSIDEAESLHEILIEPLRALIGQSTLLYYPWVLVGLVLVLIVSLLYFRFLFHLAPKYRFLFVASAILFVAGAIGFEIIDGVVESLFGEHNLGFVLLFHIEELLEMLSVVLFIYTLSVYIDEYLPRIAPAPISAITPKTDELIKLPPAL